MTSFTRKLYARDPAAAEAFHRSQQFEHRLTYGKHTQLACFTPAVDPKPVVFGKRTTPPQMALYECWCPLVPGKSFKAVLKAPDSFQARKSFAAEHGMDVTDVCARRLVGC